MGSETIILGAGGMLGRAFQRRAGAIPGARFLSRADLDISTDDLEGALTPGVRTVINCAAYTNVDRAETEVAEALCANARAVERLAKRCAEIDATLVHFSTDYVFDGAATTPYAVEAPRNPISAYGRSKALGEDALQRCASRWMCLRTSWLYDAESPSFVTAIARLASERDHIDVVSDQIGRPTCVDTLADATLRLLDLGAQGILHVSDGGEPCSRVEQAEAIIESIGARCDVRPITTEAFNASRPGPIAPRPAWSVLDLIGTEALLGPLTPWQDVLHETITRGSGARAGVGS